MCSWTNRSGRASQQRRARKARLGSVSGRCLRLRRGLLMPRELEPGSDPPRVAFLRPSPGRRTLRHLIQAAGRWAVLLEEAQHRA